MQGASHLLVVILKFSQNVLRPFLRQLDQQTLRGLNVVRSDIQVRIRGADLNDEVTSSELFRPLVQYYSIFIEVFCLSDQWHRLVCCWLRRKPSLPYISMGHTRQTIEVARVDPCSLRRPSNPRQCLILILGEIRARNLALLLWELQNLILKHFVLPEIHFPRLDAIRRLLALQSPKNSLVFCCNFHQSFLSRISIEAWNFKSFC